MPDPFAPMPAAGASPNPMQMPALVGATSARPKKSRGHRGRKPRARKGHIKRGRKMRG